MKGLSQVMYLVIAATVILVAGVSLMAMSSGSVSTAIDDAESTQMQASCEAEFSSGDVSERCYNYYDLETDDPDAKESLGEELGIL